MLKWGYNNLPEGVTAAWGARVIITQLGEVDLLHDRQSVIGDDTAVAALLRRLNEGINDTWIHRVKDMLTGYEMHTRKAQEFTLYADDEVTVIGNTNASAGYLYVAAFPTPTQP